MALATIYDRFRWVMNNPDTLNKFEENCQDFPEKTIEERNRYCILTSKTMFQISKISIKKNLELFHRQYLEPTIKTINLEGLKCTLDSLAQANKDTNFSTFVYFVGQLLIFVLIIYVINQAKTEVRFNSNYF